jgi:predicted kinase
MVGVAGSGKSTFTRKHFRRTQVVASDVCRAIVSDDEADQSATADAFVLLNSIVEMRLKRGRIAVVDATNVQAWARASLLDIAKRCQAAAVAIVLDIPSEIWREQNSGRERVVEDDVLNHQAAELAASREGLEQEGFARVYEFKSPEAVDNAKVVTEN